MTRDFCNSFLNAIATVVIAFGLIACITTYFWPDQVQRFVYGAFHCAGHQQVHVTEVRLQKEGRIARPSCSSLMLTI